MVTMATIGDLFFFKPRAAQGIAYSELTKRALCAQRAQAAARPLRWASPRRRPLSLLTVWLWGRCFHSLSFELLNAFVCICPSSESLTENRSRLPQSLSVQVLSMNSSLGEEGGAVATVRSACPALVCAVPSLAWLPHGSQSQLRRGSRGVAHVWLTGAHPFPLPPR